MRPLSQILIALIKAAEEIVTRSREFSFNQAQSFNALAEEIKAADNRPCEGERFTFSAMAVVLFVENFYGDRARSSHWQSMIGAELPYLRDDAFRQFQNEREQLKSEGVR